LPNVEALSGLDTDLLHLCNDRLIGQMRRMDLEQFGGVDGLFMAFRMEKFYRHLRYH
jgi:hypothetical protein